MMINPEEKIKYFSMFYGIKCFEMAFPKHWECVGGSEINEASIAISKYHFPNHKNYGDAQNILTEKLPNFDLLCGGFPCQAFSIAGNRKGFNDTRGTLFFEVARIAKAKRPQYILLENVQGLLSHEKGRTFKIILSTLTELGYNIQTMVLNSKYHGVPQNRKRVFIIGHLTKRCTEQLLPIRTNAGNYFKKSEPAANTITSRYGNGAAGTYPAESKYPIAAADYRYDEGLRIREDFVAPTVMTRGMKRASNIPLLVYNLAPRSDDPTKGGTGRLINQDGIAYTLMTSQTNAIQIGEDFRLRVFTETECERLQGLPDDYTKYGDYDNGTIDMFGGIEYLNLLGSPFISSLHRAFTSFSEPVNSSTGVILVHLLKSGIASPLYVFKSVISSRCIFHTGLNNSAIILLTFYNYLEKNSFLL